MSVETEHDRDEPQPASEAEPVEAELEADEPEAEAPSLESLQAERDELFARLQRVSAEFDNFQKRVKRDKSTWTADAQRGLLENLLPVLDNLDYAVAAFDREVKDTASLRQGVELVREELLRQLGNNAVVPIEAAEGTPFDPDLHQAVAVEPADVEQEEISFVARKGYRLGDLVLRPAQVGVRKPQ